MTQPQHPPPSLDSESMPGPPPSLSTGSIPGIALRLTGDDSKIQSENEDHVLEIVSEVDSTLGLVLQVSPLFEPSVAESLAQIEDQAVQTDEGYEAVGFHNWWQIRFKRPDGIPESYLAATDDQVVHPRLAELVQNLHGHPAVLNVHFLHPAPPPAVNPIQNPDYKSQKYLNSAPTGIDAPASWGYDGGDGADINIIDVEQGWNLNHQDLVGAPIKLLSGTSTDFFFHGTAVLGVLHMVDNKLGGIGISPGAKCNVVSQYQSYGYSTPGAVAAAVQNSKPGDFIILEIQEWDQKNPNSGTLWPAEIADATFHVMKAASTVGIIFVEAAANGSLKTRMGNNLDAYKNLDGKEIFNRNNAADYRESGAIMVGAASSAAPHTRMVFSNYGSRVDAFGWGENVFTTTTDGAGKNNTAYTSVFNGTSSATPIVAGAAVNMQGRVFKKTGKKWGPGLARATLTTGGTKSANPATDLIGVMPDLKAIFAIIEFAVQSAASADASKSELEALPQNKLGGIETYSVPVRSAVLSSHAA